MSESDEYMPSGDDAGDESSGSESIASSNEEEDQIEAKVRKQRFILQSNILRTPKRISNKNKPAIIHKDFVSRNSRI